MGEGIIRMVKGNGIGEWSPPCQGDCRNAAASLPPRSGADGSRVCGCTPSFCLPQELAEEWVVQLVAPSSCADQHAFLNEARAMLSVDFPGEVMRWNIAFGEACELLSAPQWWQRRSHVIELHTRRNACQIALTGGD